MGTDDPIFIVGATRSGTTLLSLMLTQHPKIAFAGELAWVLDGPRSASEDYYEYLALNRHFLSHGITIDRSLALPDLTRSFAAQMRAGVDPAGNKPFVGFQLHRHFREALTIWPRARFIHITRDGRDVAASWIKLGWLGNTYQAARWWCDTQAEWAQVSEQIDPSRKIELQFEDLIADPERELTRLCTFVGVTYDQQMLRYHESTTYAPVDRSQAGKWRTQLSPSAARIFERVAGGELIRNRYPLSEPPALGRLPCALLELENKARHHQARARIFGTRLWALDVGARLLGLRRVQEEVKLKLNAVENARMQ